MTQERDAADRVEDADDADDLPRGPLQGLDDLSDFLADHPLDSRSFVRGLTVGIFVGAMIAGSAIWRRFNRDRRKSRPPTT
jgi:hypothetical protein